MCQVSGYVVVVLVNVVDEARANTLRTVRSTVELTLAVISRFASHLRLL